MWEGIGVASYLLINFWWTRIQANKAAMLAFTMNRVGDMGLSIGFLAIFALFGSLDYATVFNLVPFMNETAITIIGLLLLIGAMAKSAQIPLHSWLPGSMEGWRTPSPPYLPSTYAIGTALTPCLSILCLTGRQAAEPPFPRLRLP
jgi:NADH:ubiquinone oxidoreductase subunit 5 (subunit L)/multisubunit Na+/H+ antiporter MnhA subunit